MLTIIIFIIKNNMIFLLSSTIPMYLYFTSNYYKNLFLSYKEIVVFSNRNLASTYIFGVIGFSLSYFKMFDKTNKKKIFLIICCSTLLILLMLYYEKVNKFYFLKFLFSISLIVLFTYLPFYKLKIENIIKQISMHTGGIYYIHINIMSLILMIYYLYIILLLYHHNSLFILIMSYYII